MPRDAMYIEMIRILQKAGYIVRHESEAQTVLSWSRTLPAPKRVDFKAEALVKIREQIELKHLVFDERSDRFVDKQITIARARLRILV